MEVQGCVALVTGANRGLGKALVEALFAAGAARVYAAARDPGAVRHPRAVPLQLDVTHDEDVRAAAADCADVNLLVNNAGVMSSLRVLDAGSVKAMQRDIDVNVYGTVAMARAFAPVLARNGGGAMVNVLSIVSWFVSPVNPSYCVSKHAAAAVTEALRLELRPQGTRVMGVYVGLMDTEMTAGIQKPKVSPQDVATGVVQGIERGEDYIRADTRAEQLWSLMHGAPALISRAINPA